MALDARMEFAKRWQSKQSFWSVSSNTVCGSGAKNIAHYLKVIKYLLALGKICCQITSDCWSGTSVPYNDDLYRE